MLLRVLLDIASTYAINKFFNHGSGRETLSRTKKIILFLLSAGFLLLSLDALTDCFGLVSYLGKRHVIRDACARACNDGQIVVETINQIENTFRVTNGHTEAATNLCVGKLSRTTAGLLTSAIPTASVVAAQIFGMWNPAPPNNPQGKKEFEILEEKKFPFAPVEQKDHPGPR